MKKNNIIKNIPVENADVVLLQIPYEATVSCGTGTKMGPKAIIDMLDYQVEEWDCLLGKRTCDEVNVVQKKASVSGFLPEEMVGKMQKTSLEYFSKNKFLISLGGEHSVSIGLAMAAKKFFGDITVVQIDAHADLRNDNSDYEENSKKITKYAHSCAMRRICDSGCRTVQIGIRSMSPEEADFVCNENIKNIFFAPVVEKIGDIIKTIKTRKVYLTIDVDGFDPAVMPGTGTLEPGGISWDWGISFLNALFSKKEVVGMDVVEVAPRKDDCLTEFSAAKIIYHLIGLKFKS